MRRVLRNLYFSYSQCFVFDESEEQHGCEWTDEHVNQGFVRRERVLAFGTILQFGTARLTVSFDPIADLGGAGRSIRCPLYLPSGKLVVMGPEETMYETAPVVLVEPGWYFVTCSQWVHDNEEVDMNINFVKDKGAGPQQSAVLIADRGLNVPKNLREDGAPVELL
ncbi:MAG: hypothetical protein HRU13_01045 [Phycisphaerales bacterium]|nr:hypothetical protein [Phycisphaerales bacterium]